MSSTRQRFLAVVIFLIVFVSIAYGGWFPITAWGIRRETLWVDSVKSWNGNSAEICWYGNNYIESLLNKGAECGIDFINGSLRTDSIPISLTLMARGQFSTYESEEHDPNSITGWPPAHGYFDADSFDYFGYSIGDTAWGIFVDSSDTAGYIQGGLVQHKGHRQEFTTFLSDADSLKYEARFYLRIPNTTDQQENKPVCRLEVFRKDTSGNYYLLDSNTIWRSSFTDTTAYETFSLWFAKDTTMITAHGKDYSPMDYRIYWHHNYDLYADRVELRDTVYYNLQEGNYDEPIGNIVDKWDGYDALKYYYLWDEPHLDQFESFDEVKTRLKLYGATKPPIACVSKRYNNHNHYIKFIKDCYGNDPTALLVDRYSLDPDANNADTIQNRFDDLCAWMDTVRQIADTTGPGDPHRPVWYFCQAHNWIRENGDTILRDPTPQEMWAIVGLGLAHGARGIWYFRYMSRYYNSDPNQVMFHALEDWDGSNWEHNSKWDATLHVNTVLQVIDTFLLDFKFQTAFSGEDIPQSYIKSTSFDTTEFGLFEESNDLKYFLVVSRRDTFSTVADTLSDSTLVTLGLDGSLHSGWYYIRDCYTGEPIKWDSTSGGKAPVTVYFNFYLKDCHFKLFQIVPFTCDIETNRDSVYTDYPFVEVLFDTTGSNFQDSMYVTMWSDEGDTIKDVRTDSTLIWQFQSPGDRTLTASFELFCGDYIYGDSGYLTPTYYDTITVDTTPPTSNDIEVEDVDTLAGFVNSDSVDLELSSMDASGPPARKMRFSNYGFSNLIQNPEFSSSINWICEDSAWVHNGYGEIDAEDGGVIYQDIDDTLLVEDKIYQFYAYVVTDSFTSDSGRIRVSYMYIDTLSGDTTYSALRTIDIQDGDDALTGYNCVSDTFTYSPNPGSGDTTFGCLLEVEQGNNGAGRLIVDNFLLERDYTESSWHDYDTTYTNWVLTSGNGEKIVSAEFRDRAGNIADAVSDTVIVDATDPVGAITSPQNNQVVSGTISIRGWAYDASDPDSHFYYYKLEYKPTTGEEWSDCDSVYYYEAKYPDPNQPGNDSSVVLGQWDTPPTEGYYNLRLTVVDSATNNYDTTMTVRVSHFGPKGFGEFGAGKEPAGISSLSHLFITDAFEGKLRKYNSKGDSIGYISLLEDSSGISKPCAVVIDSGGIWIGDKHTHMVTCYDYEGDTLFTFGGYGDKRGEFNEPGGIAIYNDKVYVTDRYNHRVQVFKKASFLFSFGEKGDSTGQFNEPMGIASDRHGRIYVTDKLNNRIEVFDTTGKYIGEFGKDIELKHPGGIMVDNSGYIFVVDEGNGRVIELDHFGDPICTFGEKGEGFGRFLLPRDVAISGNGEKLYVTDSEQRKVVIFKVYDKESGGGPMSAGKGETPIVNCLKTCYPVPFKRGVNISYSIEKKGYVSVKIYDVTGRLVRRVVDGLQDRGWYTIEWNSNNKNNKPVSSGVYFIRLKVGDFMSTKKVLLVK